MPPKRRRASPWPWVAASLALLLLPAGFSQRVRLSALSVLLPLRQFALGLVRLPSNGEAQQLRTENDYLKDQIQKLLDEKARLNARLEMATGLKPLVKDPQVRLLQADVVFSTDGSPWRKSITLAAGASQGVVPGLLVLYHQQVVGRVLECGPWTSRVQVVTDPGFKAAGVAVPRGTAAGVSFNERHVGVYEGTAGRNGTLKWITGDTPVEDGAVVMTTGDPERRVPQGLILGRVVSVNSGRGAFPRVEVEPSINLQGLEQVTILVPDAPTREEARR
jgi:rod shape-determining protein MreC